MAETVDFAKIKLGYYGGMKQINPTGILPRGPDLDFAAPHDRGRRAHTGAPATAGVPGRVDRAASSRYDARL